MAYLKWDQAGERVYEVGVKKVALYLFDSSNENPYSNGVAWNGVTNITEKPTGAEENALWADDIKYASLRSTEEFEASIEAFTYPDEFAQCDGSAEIVVGITIGQQARKTFGLAYITTKGNDTDNLDYGYKVHIIYGATASPSEKQHETINTLHDSDSRC